MLYQRFRMRTKCVCCILSIFPTALFSRANIISRCPGELFRLSPTKSSARRRNTRRRLLNFSRDSQGWADPIIVVYHEHQGGGFHSLCVPLSRVKRERTQRWYTPAHCNFDSQKQNRSGVTGRKGFGRLRLTNSGQQTYINSLRFNGQLASQLA